MAGFLFMLIPRYLPLSIQIYIVNGLFLLIHEENLYFFSLCVTIRFHEREFIKPLIGYVGLSQTSTHCVSRRKEERKTSRHYVDRLFTRISELYVTRFKKEKKIAVPFKWKIQNSMLERSARAPL